MANIITYTLSEYIRSRKTLKDKINATEQMISKLEDKILEGIDDSNTSEYLLDDGQVRVQSRYRSVAEIEQGLQALEKMLQRYINQYNGRIYVLRGRLNH
jgi:hypothetical protein